MKILAIDHVQLAIPPNEEDKARVFYRDILDLMEKPKPPHLAKRGGLWFESGSVKIHLGIEKDFMPAKKAHPALLVEGLKQLVERCSSAGYEVINDEQLEGYNRRYIKDPFGNRIEVMEKILIQ